MSDPSIYDDIRPYRDHEYGQVMENLLASPLSDILIASVFPGLPAGQIKEQMRSIKSINEFQGKVIYYAIESILKNSSSGFTHSGLENLKPGKAYLFISNHRDILLDPALFNYVIYKHGLETAEIAIGDNLMQTLWVRDLARLNKSFIVKRNLSVRELVTASRHLSSYIYNRLVENQCSVWIAQREGRAKDGNDRTQPGVLNMIGLSNKGELRDHFINMNILPVSISYEYDPCDTDKVRSLYAQKFFGGYTKEKNEDNLAMKKGIQGFKGAIHIHFGELLNEKIRALPGGLHKNELIGRIAKMIDQEIIGNYKLHRTNRIAFDVLYGSDENTPYYTPEDKARFMSDIEDKAKGMAGEEEELITIFLEMYARPCLNKKELLPQ